MRYKDKVARPRLVDVPRRSCDVRWPASSGPNGSKPVVSRTSLEVDDYVGSRAANVLDDGDAVYDLTHGVCDLVLYSRHILYYRSKLAQKQKKRA